MMLAAFIIPRIIITTYGSDINGIVTSVTQFIAYFVLVEAGISGASIYALYKPLAEKNISSINGILSASKKFYILSGYIFLTLVVLLALFYPYIIKGNILPYWKISIIVFALGTSGALDFFTLSKYRVLLTADQRSYIISISQIVYWGLNVVLTYFLAKAKCDIVLLQVILLTSVFVRSFILWYYVKEHYDYINYSVEPDISSIKERWNVLYLQLLGSIQSACPVILATVFLQIKEVSVYAIYNMVVSGIDGILSVFTAGLSASFGDVIVRKERKTLQKAYREFEQMYYLFISVVYSVSLLLIIPFISLYTKGVKDAEYILPTLGTIIVLNGLLYNIKTPQGMMVVAAGMYRQTRWQTTIQGSIALIGGLIGVKFLGLYGIVIGLMLSNIYRDIDLLFFVPKNITKLSHMRTVRNMSAVLFTLIPALYISFKYPIEIDNFIQWILYGALFTFAFFIWALFINLIIDKQNMLDIFKRIGTIISKKIK
ncbi:lipopolysaccharide biosynthesis protein [Candidatus Proelusimicrobium volucris]|uniref:lipopolysaccharide biosynthesis protein n=1 Tax=Candidatus Proelusimicrobium volucris TaxID=3416225 RepID=UPI003D108447